MGLVCLVRLVLLYRGDMRMHFLVGWANSGKIPLCRSVANFSEIDMLYDLFVPDKPFELYYTSNRQYYLE